MYNVLLGKSFTYIVCFVFWRSFSEYIFSSLLSIYHILRIIRPPLFFVVKLRERVFMYIVSAHPLPLHCSLYQEWRQQQASRWQHVDGFQNSRFWHSSLDRQLRFVDHTVDREIKGFCVKFCSFHAHEQYGRSPGVFLTFSLLPSIGRTRYRWL